MARPAGNTTWARPDGAAFREAALLLVLSCVILAVSWALRSDRLPLLADARIEFILSSDYHRTRDTVAPLAAALGIEVEIYDPRELPTLVERLGAREGRGVVVGHSNTTPALVELLGGDPGEPIDEMEFDRLYIVHPDGRGNAMTVRLRY